MAKLTGTQKKKRNQFVALLIAIVVVLAAIFYVAYSAFMAKSAFLENQDFAAALGMAFDKSARKVSAQDLAEVKYVEAQSDGEYAYIAMGDEKFAEDFVQYSAEADAAAKAEEAGETVPEITTQPDVNNLKVGEFEVDEDVAEFTDLKYFTGAKVVNLIGFELDAETLAQFKNVTNASFSGCGIDNEELKVFAEAIDTEKVEKLTFMSNSIDDWTPLQGISDKVVIQSYGLQMTEDGQYTVATNEQTLTEYLEAQAKAEAEAAAEAEAEENAGSETEEAPEVTEETETAEVTE